MLQTLIITLREGVEAALVVAIAIAYLRKIGRRDLLPAVHRAFGSAVIASFGFAWLLSRLGLGEDSYEGWTLLTSNRASGEPDRPPPERIVGDGKASFRETLKLLADSIVWRRTPLLSSKSLK